ncbi:MAG: hypothetical protein KJN71_06270, partial [Acidimicrobiia bacterium]|nr:hypothetical protein [Acidimicrobiia bacterium]
MESRPRILTPPSAVASATAALVVHGVLLASGSYQRTYDAYVHIFFADHYAQDWFSTWETRWYTGFTTTSYPPGTHQLMGLLSGTTGLLGAFVIVQLVAVVALVIGVYRYARLWVGEDAARWAALLAVMSSAIAETIHVFGQLPTTFSLAALLHAMPALHRWMAEGSRRSLLVGVATMAATTAGHHVTTLFGSVFFLGPVVVRVVVDALRRPAPGEHGHLVVKGAQGLKLLVVRRLQRVAPTLLRVATTAVVLVVTLVIVVLPYWLWTAGDPISQVPIPHDSRSNFITNPNAGLVFWVIPWGTLLLLLPGILRRAIVARTWPLAMSVGLLFVLGTGGTTPIPRLLLGGAFDVLTLDRFTFWATIAVLPVAGARIEELGRAVGQSRIRTGLLGAFAAGTIAMFMFSANLSHYRSLQPEPIDPQPIAEFLAKDDHSRWRYLPLGFGDQMAWVSANTEATTVDGNYHSARRLPELVSRPVERLEGAKFRGMPGIGSLQQFVTTPERYNLKFVFSNDTFYDPLLFANGWHELGPLRNGIVVWERADVSPLPPVLPERQLPSWQRLLWGIVPLTSVGAAGVLQVWSRAGEPVPKAVARRLPPAGAFEGVRP